MTNISRERAYIFPVCSDGGIVYDHHMTLALAMGADFLMLGRYFSRFDESPHKQGQHQRQLHEGILGRGSARARNWQRYDMGGDKKLSFEEGVDSYVPYAGSLKDNLGLTLSKVRSTMLQLRLSVHSGVPEEGKITLVSATSIVEGGARCCAQGNLIYEQISIVYSQIAPQVISAGQFLSEMRDCMKGRGRHASE